MSRYGNFHTYFEYGLAFFGMLDVVVVVSLFHLNGAHLHNVTSIHVDYVVVYELFFAPVCENTWINTNKQSFW